MENNHRFTGADHNTVCQKTGLRTPGPSGFSLYTPGDVVGLFIQGPMERM
jgi:hypothetical protein